MEMNREDFEIDFTVIENKDVSAFEKDVTDYLYDGYDFCSDVKKDNDSYMVTMRRARPTKEYVEKMQKAQEEAKKQAEEANND